AYLGLVANSAAGFLPARLMHSMDIPSEDAIADVDGDGLADVVVVHAGWNTIGVYRRLPAGGLAEEELYDAPYINSGPQRLAAGDIDGDGRPDLVTADSNLAVLHHQ